MLAAVALVIAIVSQSHAGQSGPSNGPGSIIRPLTAVRKRQNVRLSSSATDFEPVPAATYDDWTHTMVKHIHSHKHHHEHEKQSNLIVLIMIFIFTWVC